MECQTSEAFGGLLVLPAVQRRRFAELQVDSCLPCPAETHESEPDEFTGKTSMTTHTAENIRKRASEKCGKFMNGMSESGLTPRGLERDDSHPAPLDGRIYTKSTSF